MMFYALVHIFLLVHIVLSQNPDGPEDCIATIDTSSPNTVIGVPEGTVCIQCVIGGSNATSATFQISNANIDPSYAIVVNGILIVFDTAEVFDDDPTSVRCTQGSTVTIFVTIAVYAPPMVGTMADGVLAGRVLTINETDDLALDCDSSNSHNGPPVFWTDQDGVNVSDGRALEIDNIMRSDAGNYTCVTNLQDPANSRSTTIQVIVQYIPDVFADSQGVVDVPVNGTLVLSCTLEGVPPPSSVSWRHNSSIPVNTSDPRVTIDSTETSTTLMIEGVRDDEGGRYDCVATNVVGSNSSRSEVRILLDVCDSCTCDEGYYYSEVFEECVSLDDVYIYEPTILEGCDPERNAEHRAQIQAEISALISELLNNK